MFGDAPTSVFSDTHAIETGGANNGWAANGREEARDSWNNDTGGDMGHEGDAAIEGGTDDNWGLLATTTPAAEEPTVAETTTPMTPKSKCKNSTILAPASGLASTELLWPSVIKNHLFKATQLMLVSMMILQLLPLSWLVTLLPLIHIASSKGVAY